MSDDTIKTYVTPASVNLWRYCYSCARQRPVWIGETKGGDTLTCCAYCQYVIERRRTEVTS